MVSTLKVNTVLPQSGTSITFGASGDTITIAAGVTWSGSGASLTDLNATQLTSGTVPTARLSAIPNASLANSAITINGSAVSLGGSVTVGETKPTISSISPSVVTNAQTAITITGTNYVSVPYVDAINSSTGAIVQADSVSFSGATSIVATFTLAVDGTYFIRVENNDGNAVRSGSAILTVSDEPAWVTAAGSLGTFAGGETISVSVSATSATSYAIQSGSLPGGLSLNTSTGAITGTESGATGDTTYNFTIRATDAEAQTSDRAFSIAITLGISNAMRFE